MSWDPYGYYQQPGGYPPPPSAGYPPPYQGYQGYPQQPPPPHPSYPYPAHPQGYPPAGYPPQPAPYAGYYPPPPQHAQYPGYPPPPAQHQQSPPPAHYASPPPQPAPAPHQPPPPPAAAAAPPAAKEGELHPPPDVGVDPNSFRRFFASELANLTYNSKPVITALTLFAHEHSVRMSGVVAQCMEEHLRTCPTPYLLPSFYLLDSISKNIGPPYLTLFARFLERTFLSSYHAVDASTKTKLEELLGTWKTGASDGGELFRMPEEKGREGRVQRGIEVALWGVGGRKGGMAGGTREGSKGYGNGVAQVPHPPPPSGPTAAATASPSPAPQAAPPPPAGPATATTSERSGVLYDVRRLLALRQEAAERVPGDEINKGQIVALGKLESLILNTQLTTQQVNQIRAQLAALAPPPAPPAPAPVVEAPPPAVPTAPTAPAEAANPLAGIDLSLLNNLAATGALANLFSPQPPVTGSPAPELKPFIQDEDSALPSASVVPKVEVPDVKEKVVVVQEKEDDAAGLWEGEVMRMGVGLGNGEVALPRPQAPNVLYTLLPLSCSHCGLRMFDSRQGKRKMDMHLDWHFVQKRRIREHAGRTVGRGWCTGEEEWYSSSTSSSLDPSSSSTSLPLPSSSSISSAPLDKSALLKAKVPVQEGLGGDPCPICQDRFKSEWSDEEEEWVWWNAVVVEGMLYHATCHAETTLSSARSAVLAATASSAAASSSSQRATRDSTPVAKAGLRKRPAPGEGLLFRPDGSEEAGEGEGGRAGGEGDGEGEDRHVLKKVKSEPGLEDEGGTGGMPALEDGAEE
ncbi:hypothetical protein JCM8547_006388 [Rhodosporidiobolus lusitaniae]